MPACDVSCTPGVVLLSWLFCQSASDISGSDCLCLRKRDSATAKRKKVLCCSVIQANSYSVVYHLRSWQTANTLPVGCGCDGAQKSWFGSHHGLDLTVLYKFGTKFSSQHHPPFSTFFFAPWLRWEKHVTVRCRWFSRTKRSAASVTFCVQLDTACLSIACCDFSPWFLH